MPTLIVLPVGDVLKVVDACIVVVLARVHDGVEVARVDISDRMA